MDPTLLAVLVVAAIIAAVYFLFIRKPAPKQLEQVEDAKPLGPKKPNELAEKLEAKRNEQQKPTDSTQEGVSPVGPAVSPSG